MADIKVIGGTFREEGHSYFDEKGIQVPSVTQVLASVGLVDFSRVKPEVLLKKRNIGLKVHAAAEFLDTPEKGELRYETITEDFLGYVMAYEQFCEETKFRPFPEYVERSGIHVVHGMPFGYRIDRVGEISVGAKRVPIILEIKCGYKEEIAWPLQLAAYGMTPLPKLTMGFVVYERVALQLKKDARFKVFRYEDKYDERHFLSALSLTHYKMRAKISLPDVPEDIGEDEDEAA